MTTTNAASPLLVVDNLTTTFHTARGPLPAVGGVSFELGHNQTLGVVGESGSGKTVLSRTIMGLQPRVNVEVGGSAILDGHQIVDVVAAPEGHALESEVVVIVVASETCIDLGG